MALFEALGELAGAALVAAGPAFDVRLSASHMAKYRELMPWLRGRSDASSAAADAIIDGLARDIWVSGETRGLAQNAIEHHALAVAELLVAYPPQAAVLRQAIEKSQATAQGQTAPADSVARRIAVDVFARARTALGAHPTGLKDDVALLLIDRVYAHILEDARVLGALQPAVRQFLGKIAPAAQAPGHPAGKPDTPQHAPPAQTPAVNAPALGKSLAEGLAAAGGQAFIAKLRERFGLSETALNRILIVLEGQGIRGEQIAARLEELCAWLGEVRAQLQKPSNEDAETRRLKTKAAQALAEGDFTAAAEALKALRRQIREGRRQIEARLAEEVSALRDQMMEEARAAARLAELALAAMDFTAAAELFGEAVIALPTADRDLAWHYGLQRAEALYRAAETRDDSDALSEAIAAFGQATRGVADGSNQKGLGRASLGLANALALDGRREEGSQRLKDAATTYRKAISILGRDVDPKSWTEAHVRLGQVLALIGEREQASAALREASEAFRIALKDIKPELMTSEFIAAEMGLGNALLGLEEREGGTSLLTEAAAAYRAVLATLKRDSDPELWAEAQMNMGLALLGLGEQQVGGDHLQGSVAAFKAALQATPRETAAKKWALIQLNLGNALAALGDRDRQSPQKLDDAVAAYQAALEEFVRESEPLKWAITQMNLGTAYIRLGEHRDKRRSWLAAAGALVPALEVFEVQGANAYADVTRQNLRRFHDSWDALIAGPTAPPAAQAQAQNRGRLPKAS